MYSFSSSLHVLSKTKGDLIHTHVEMNLQSCRFPVHIQYFTSEIYFPFASVTLVVLGEKN